AASPDEAGVAVLARIWAGLRRSDVFPVTLRSALGLISHPGYLVDPSGLRRLIETNLPFPRLEDAAIPLHIMATNQQGQPVRLSSGSAVEAILASAAIPGVFPPVDIGGGGPVGGALPGHTPLSFWGGAGAAPGIVLAPRRALRPPAAPPPGA